MVKTAVEDKDLLIQTSPVRYASRDRSFSTCLSHYDLDRSKRLLNRQWEKGIHLTLIGLKEAVSNDDRAAGYANLCAAYIALKQYERALENCDRSIAIAETNWRAWQNRAAAKLKLGRIDDSMRDIERGLAINPKAQALQETLEIAREWEKLQRQQLRALVES